ncbi:Histidine phosphatase superfamily clade-1 [Penicillium expansum]|nr:Histidine phosphatase superfamily clade-1 [Penicillium expansum]
MAAQVHIVRHAESVHNVSKDYTQRDPSLTPLGLQQAAQLVHEFPYSSQVAVIITSPLQRAIQTALAAFPHVLDKRYFGPHSGQGIENGSLLMIDPELQERSAFPCDTGSSREVLEEAFHIDFSDLAENWHIKEGLYSPDDNAVNVRAKSMRTRVAELMDNLKDKEKRDVVIVTHGVFMKFLVEDPEIDLPKAGWKSYTVGENGSGKILLPF